MTPTDRVFVADCEPCEQLGDPTTLAEAELQAGVHDDWQHEGELTSYVLRIPAHYTGRRTR